MRNPPALRLVKQENRNSGCGPACLAMVSGVSYEEAVEALFGTAKKRGLRTRYPQIRAGLRKLKVPHAKGPRLHRNWAAITGISIVKCGVNDDNEWHWVVYDGRTGDLYDPLADRVREPDGRSRKISSHLPVWQRGAAPR